MRSFLDYFGSGGFIQISKSTIVNLYRIKQVKTDLNMRLKLVMDNDELIVLNRRTRKIFLTHCIPYFIISKI